MQGNVVRGRIHWWEPKRAVPRLLSGIEAGVLGGIAMLALLVSGSLWRGDPWWMPSNLLGSTFYGARALSAGPERATLAGGALHVFITGSIGAAFGLVFGGIRHKHRLVLLGALAGLLWHGLADAVLWRRINPLVPIYSAQPATLFSHALFGVCLGYLSRKFPAAQERAAGEPECCRMTVYAAVGFPDALIPWEGTLTETLVGSRTSKKTSRRVERNRV